MDKFMPKTIEELNAEFEARMEKAKQDELNAAAEKAAEEILEAERMRAAHNAEEKAEARRVEERSYESALDSSIPQPSSSRPGMTLRTATRERTRFPQMSPSRQSPRKSKPSPCKKPKTNTASPILTDISARR